MKKSHSKKSPKKKHVEEHPHTFATQEHVPAVFHSHSPELAKRQKKSLEDAFAAACEKMPPARKQFATDEQRAAYVQFVKANS